MLLKLGLENDTVRTNVSSPAATTLCLRHPIFPDQYVPIVLSKFWKEGKWGDIRSGHQIPDSPGSDPPKYESLAMRSASETGEPDSPQKPESHTRRLATLQVMFTPSSPPISIWNTETKILELPGSRKRAILNMFQQDRMRLGGQKVGSESNCWVRTFHYLAFFFLPHGLYLFFFFLSISGCFKGFLSIVLG